MTVTLITGDKVTVQPDGGVTVVPAAGRERVLFQQAEGDLDHIQVLPSDAVQLVAEGKLDSRLFDVSYLIREGFDDASRSDMPLLIDGRAATIREVATSSRAAGSAAKVTREFPRVGLSAVAQDKKTAIKLWSQLTTPAKGSKAAKGSSLAVLPAGVERVGLDAKVRITLDRSVPQVAAPAAWQAGFDGTGTTVAVLDTGVDGTHPDLAGKVAAERNFTSEPTAADGNGHGTHVASTVAGSGEASEGKYKGVASGAVLMNGKVCNRGGSCATSWVVAGMEWAATSGADVINMSLGGTDKPGIDFFEEAVNRLTAQTGALFVVSAGNEGPSARTVSSPGSADAALTVAAVDKSDKVADFSSRGPRVGDGAVKPDIAAPGVGIVAARGVGTGLGAPVNDRYTALNGTSMAAPHVAGGAAILAQRYPDWTATQLKAGLMGAATPLDGAKVFEVGTGRLDVHRAVTQQVLTTTPSVSFGLVEYPYNVPPATGAVTYRNDGVAPVMLNLAVSATDQDGAPAPAGMFTLDTTTLTVPAGGTASATVTVNPAGQTAGMYGGRITATGSDGQRVQTAVGIELEPESYDLAVNMLDRNGNPPSSSTRTMGIQLYDHAGGVPRWLPIGGTTRLPATEAGYGISAFITTTTQNPDNRRGELDEMSMMAYPELKLTKNTTLTMDARKTRKMTIKVDKPTARLFALKPYAAFRGRIGDRAQTVSGGAYLGGPLRYDGLYVGTMGSSSDKFYHGTLAQFTEPLIRLDVSNGRRDGFGVDVWYGSSGCPTCELNRPARPLLGTQRMGVVHGGAGTPDDLAGIEAADKLVVLDLPPAQDSDLVARVKNVHAAGGRAVLLDRSPLEHPRIGTAVTDLPVLLAADPQRSRLVTLARAAGTGRSGDTTVTTHGIRTTPYQYNLWLPTEGNMPADPTHRVSDRDLARVEATFRHTGTIRRSNQREIIYGNTHFRYTYADGTIADPEQRVEYYTPGLWARETSEGSGIDMIKTVPRDYAAGMTYRVTESAASMGPSFATKPAQQYPLCITECRPEWAYRRGDSVDIRLPLFSDHRSGGYSTAGAGTGYTRMYRNGQLIGETNWPGWAPDALAFAVPSGQANYRLETDATLSTARQHSTNVHAAWTFSSDTTSAEEALPLMAVRYKPSLDVYNRGPAAKKVHFPVWVEHQNTTTQRSVTELAVEASFDDGQTWHPVQLRRDRGDRWIANLTNPYSGFVTLRAIATDADGNTVNQTIKRAYSVRP